MITDSLYKKWKTNKLINPITNRKIKKDGPIYNLFKNYNTISFDTGVYTTGPKLEDRYVIEKYKDGLFVAVLDGHGGNRCVIFSKKHLFKIFSSIKETNMDKKINKTFILLDDMYKKYLNKHNIDDSSGTTLSLMVILKNKYYAANVGDSRIIAKEKDNIFPLTKDHNPNLEITRIQATGDKIRFSGTYRLGSLAISRTIGDFDVKKKYKSLICIPEIISRKTKKNSIFVLASDGLYDVMTNNSIFSFIGQCKDMKLDSIAKKLVYYSIQVKKSTDDVTALIIKT